VLPTALVIIAIFNLAKGDENAFADRLISHMNLDASTASLVHDLFGTTANNLVAASVTIVIGFLLWGLSIGQQYQDIYARAWRIHVGTAADQIRFMISLRSLLPGALLATFVLGGTIATSPLWIGPTLDQNGKAFGAFGVVIALVAYILIAVTISMVCAVFGPVWAEWRQGENDRKG
jgi:uncharacterized BrkB/YihY/UPF0761 family membrane protein